MPNPISHAFLTDGVASSRLDRIVKMATSISKAHRFPFRDRLLAVLILGQCLLWFAERFQLFPFNQKRGWTVLVLFVVAATAIMAGILWHVIGAIVYRRFELRRSELLLEMAIIAVPSIWLWAQINAAHAQAATVQRIKTLGGHTQKDWESDLNGVPVHDLMVGQSKSTPPAPAWLLRALGEDFFACVTEVSLDGTNAVNADLAGVASLAPLRVLGLRRTSITDEGLKCIRNLTHLEGLNLTDTLVTDEGLEDLERLSELQILDLCGTRITDKGLVHLEKLRKLEYLNIQHTAITDSGLDHFRELGQMKLLSLYGTKVTANGINKLKDQLPHCQIDR